MKSPVGGRALVRFASIGKTGGGTGSATTSRRACAVRAAPQPRDPWRPSGRSGINARIAMKVTVEDLRATAALAQLEVPEEEVERTLRALSAILGYVEKLSEVDVSDVPPM